MRIFARALCGGFIALAGCAGSTAPIPDLDVSDFTTIGCTKDTDCKGDRICVQGGCTSPASPDASAADLALPGGEPGASDLAAADRDAFRGGDGAAPDLAVDLGEIDAPPGADLAVGDLPVPDLAGRDVATRDLVAPDIAVADLSVVNGARDLATPDLASVDLARPDLAGADGGAYGRATCSKRFGDSDDQYATAVAFDPAGNVFLYGVNRGTVDFGAGAITTHGFDDLFLAKFDSSCNLLWSKGWGSPGASEAAWGNSVAVDGAGNVVIAGLLGQAADLGGGVLQPGAFFARYDPFGKYLVGRSFEDGWGAARSYTVATNAAGEIALGGAVHGNSTIDFGGGALKTPPANPSAFVAKFDASGKHVWSHVFGQSSNANSQQALTAGVAVDAAGNVLAGVDAYLGGVVDYGLGPLLSEGVVLKFEGKGTLLWNVGFGPGASANSIALEPNGDLVASGDIRGDWNFGNGLLKAGGTVDAFLVRLDGRNGQSLWSRRFGISDETVGQSVAIDGAGEIALAGDLWGTADFGSGPLVSAGGPSDYFVARFDPSGNPIWSAHYGDVATQARPGIAASATGRIALGGLLYGTVDFGNGPLVDVSGRADAVLAIFPH